MSLDSKYNKINRFTNLLAIFKNIKPKNSKTQLKKEQIKKNVDDLQERYYNAYKNDYDTDELSEAKNKKIDFKQFELCDKTDKKLTLDEEESKRLKTAEKQKIKLNDERNSANNKNKNDEFNNILSVINRIYEFFEYEFFPGESK